MSIFNYLDYRSYIRDLAKQRGRGARAEWAEAMGVQKGYLTQVLKDRAHISLEQADRLAAYLGLNDGEKDYLLLLLQKERSGTPSLESHFQKKLAEVRDKQLSVRKRFHEDHKLSLRDQMLFYSNWHYAAIHIALGISTLRTPEEIGNALKIPITTVRETLKFFLSCGLAEEAQNGHYLPLTNQSFLSGESPLIQRHHLNWRLKALQNLERNRTDEIHYSAVVSLSRTDCENLQRKLLETIAEFKREVTKSSQETEIQVLTMDYFSLL